MAPNLLSVLNKPNWPSKDVAKVLEGAYDHDVLVNFSKLTRTERINLLLALGFTYNRRSNSIPFIRLNEILKAAATDNCKSVNFLGAIVSKYFLIDVQSEEERMFASIIQESRRDNPVILADHLIDKWLADYDVNGTDVSIRPLEAMYAPINYLSNVDKNSHFDCDLSKLKFRFEGKNRIKKQYEEEYIPPETPSSVNTGSKGGIRRSSSSGSCTVVNRSSSSFASSKTQGGPALSFRKHPIQPAAPKTSSMFIKRPSARPASNTVRAAGAPYARPVECRSMVTHHNGSRTQQISFNEMIQFNQSISKNHDQALEENRIKRMQQIQESKRRRASEAEEARAAKHAARARR